MPAQLKRLFIQSSLSVHLLAPRGPCLGPGYALISTETLAVILKMAVGVCRFWTNACAVGLHYILDSE